MAKKLWGGRFKLPADRRMEEFSSSLPVDRRLYRADIEAGLAQARVLEKGGYLSAGETRRIGRALRTIRKEIESGRIKLSGSHEDIHSLILDHLVRKTGSAGKKLHAGRSRNDLVVLDTRLYLKEELPSIDSRIADLQKSLVKKGEEYADLLIPGYTHLQHAQPVLFAHHLLAYVEMLDRDRGRLRDAGERLDVLPSGSAALAGSSLKLDQRLMARLLGFKRISANSLDAVSDRDFMVEILSALSLIGMHLSRLAEELVWWSSREFGFAQLHEAYCTGSSFLPQKRNPDPAELIRGKTGRLYGNLVGLLTVLKGLPLAYNRDLQEDKEPLFDSLDTVEASLEIMTGVTRTLKMNREAVVHAWGGDYTSAADLAEYLVKKGVAFQEAHLVVGKLVRRALKEGRDLSALTLPELKRFSPRFESSALALLTPEASVRAKKTIGSTAPGRVRKELERWKAELQKI